MPTLNWIGKKAVVKHHKDVPYRLLELVPELSCGDSQSGNLIVQGDNLHALKALLPRYAGKVKCIYIDPPYNTGNEGWVYNDNVNSPEIRKWLGAVVGKEGETLDRHDRWLCMMYQRLVLLREFLSADGAIFVSIDDNEGAHLRLLMDEIFGAGNFIADVIWQKRASPDPDTKFISPTHDTILAYSKSISVCKLNRLQRTDAQDARYENPDNDSRGIWTSSDLTRREYRERDYYGITLPSGREVFPAQGRSWSIPPESFELLKRENRIWFGAKGDSMPRRKRFLSEVRDGVVPTTLWSGEEAGRNEEGKREIKKLFPIDLNVFATPKPEKLIQRIIYIVTSEGDLVLDSFLGSGTTAAVAHKMNRRYIGIEMGEHAETHCQTRLQKVVAGEQGGISKAVNWTGGGGFQFCRLSKAPLFTADGQVRTDVSFAQLAEFVWFKETGSGYAGKGDSPLLGVFDNRAVYLLYNGILKDKTVNGGNVLTPAIFKTLPGFDGSKIIYAAAVKGGAGWIVDEQITFKQTPYALEL